MSGLWVFGYGSLVSPASFGHTIGRAPQLGIDFFEAEISGFGRRWNYGVMHSTGKAPDEGGRMRDWTIVALGVVEAAGESTNGVIGWVDDDELVDLDRRERHYDRVDVSALATVYGAGDISGSIVTYVPREEPRRWYEDARDRGEAAVEQRYWHLVDGAFADLGADRRERYLTSTPSPDVPIIAMERDSVPPRHQVRSTD